MNNSEDNCDIIEIEDEFDYDKKNINLINNTDLLSKKRVDYLPNQKNNPINNINISTVKTNAVKQENGKENDNNNNNGILNDSYNNKDLNMELSESKQKITPNDMQRSTIFGNLTNNMKIIGKK